MKKRKRWLYLIGLLAGLMLTGVALAQVSTNFDLSWHLLSGGGGSRSSADYQLDDSLGQWADGSSSSANYEIEPGFWYGVAIPIGAPNLAIVKTVEPTGDVNAGDYLTYTVTLSNSGQADATVTITDTLPSELLLIRGFDGGTSLTWSGVVTGENEVQLTLVVQATPTITITTTVSNTVTIDDGVNAPFDIHSPDTTVLVGYHYIYLPIVARNY